MFAEVKIAFRMQQPQTPDNPSDTNDMSDSSLQIRYDGPELRAHQMDVALLAPALLAFGELCKDANSVLNGERAKVRVLLHADVRANCVTIDLSVVQTLWDAAVSLVKQQDVASAKDILEWIGLRLCLNQMGSIKHLLFTKKRPN